MAVIRRPACMLSFQAINRLWLKNALCLNSAIIQKMVHEGFEPCVEPIFYRDAKTLFPPVNTI